MCSIMGFPSKDLSDADIHKFFDRTRSPGSDAGRILLTQSGYLCFRRSAVTEPEDSGMQPFTLRGDAVVCSGKIRGFRQLRRSLAQKYPFRSESDCAVLLPMFREYGLSMFARLDAEFALILCDGITNALIAARDSLGIRPLFYGYDAGGSIVFASEAENLTGLCAEIFPFPPGHYYAYGKFVRYRCPAPADIRLSRGDSPETVCREIRKT